MPNWLHKAGNSKFAYVVRKMIPAFVFKRICRYRVALNYSKESYIQMYDWIQSEMTYFSCHTVINRVVERSGMGGIPYQVKVTSIEFFFRSKADAAMFKLMFADHLVID